MARAIWNGTVLAQTDHLVLLEGNVYFPPEDVRHEYLVKTRATETPDVLGREGVEVLRGRAVFTSPREPGQHILHVLAGQPVAADRPQRLGCHVRKWHVVARRRQPHPIQQQPREPLPQR
jgi:hypothetical protein